ncbi:MAG: hypothetical protein HY327_13850 [Chloroflexi bacterium]|nr:hypothetical protein [Chloroflexota bacterium]
MTVQLNVVDSPTVMVVRDAVKVMFGVPLQPLGFGCGCCGGCTAIAGVSDGVGEALVAPDRGVSVDVALVAKKSGVSVGVLVASGVNDGNISGVSVAASACAGVDVGVGVGTPISISIGTQAARATTAQRVSAIKFQSGNFFESISSLL